MEIKPIAYIHTDFSQKFGIPRQSNLVAELCGYIEFEPDYDNADCIRGLDTYSYLWLIWGFSENMDKAWRPTVRPPKLGGNIRKGVFATRAPVRPNPLGLSSVRLERIEKTRIYVSGADMLDGTPIYDIKPYCPEVDSHPDAKIGFMGDVDIPKLEIKADDAIRDSLIARLGGEKYNTLIKILAMDPRPGYQKNEREYGMEFSGVNVRFRIMEKTLSITGFSELGNTFIKRGKEND